MQVKSANSFDGSAGGAPSTLDMMAINASAAPAPTMDALSAAFGPRASITGPASGGSMNTGRNRNQSHDSLDTSSFVSGHSNVSQASAPPPAAPPPPPPPGADAGSAYSGSGYNPFGGSAPEERHAAKIKSKAPPPAAPTNSFGGPPSYGAPPAMSMYGGAPPAPASYGKPMDPYAPTGSVAQQPPSYGQPPPGPPSYGQPPPPQPHYGQPPPPQQYGRPQYGQPPGNTNPFG